MSLRIEVADLGLPALDALDVDALLVFVGPERPLQGLAGYADWRLCGALSRAMRSGLYQAAPGEALLLPSGGRLRPGRVFCFGLPAASAAPAEYLATVRKACQALRRAGSAAFASSLPPIEGGDAAAAARLWLEGSLSAPVGRQVLLGDARTLHHDLLEARASASAEVEVVAASARAEPSGRAARPAAPAGAMVR
ncbi:MAG TPA: M17 family peptidase N-terminal domain-containing protein [Anaeromyxobacteraceae bacterium]|nr:M17 family peptidase N-terminal domain-containing protein [Anaeromyxobacteraceae bacterium]